jgi:pyruvate dehydrogenase E2 component (dihydrolipoamide acetyltransferase)
LYLVSGIQKKPQSETLTIAKRIPGVGEVAVEKIQVPDIGEDQEVEVIEILVSPGDEVSENDSLLVLESDKAAMEIPSPKSGVIKEVLVKVGDQVSQGADIVSIESAASTAVEDKEEVKEEVKEKVKKEVKEKEKVKAEVKAENTETTPAPASAPSGTSTQEILVPDLGGDSDVEVIEILVSVGDEINKEDGLVTLESDKAAMDVPSPAAGKVTGIKLKVGDKVNEGSLILELETAGTASASPAPVKEEKPETVGASSEAAAKAEPAPVIGKAHLSEVKVPDLGEDSDVEVIEILVAVGDAINKEDGLITLETDKAAMDVPSPAAGIVKSIKIKIGDKVSEGSVILELEVEGETGEVAPQQAPVAESPSAVSTPVAEKAAPQAIAALAAPQSGQAKAATTEVYAGPAVRKLARELGVELPQVPGSGAKGRIVKEDVHAFVKTRMQGASSVAPAVGAGLPVIDDIDFSKFGDIEEVELSKMHRVTAKNMTRNWLNVPHVTQFDEADITDLEEFRHEQKALAEKKGIKLTPLPFIVKACAQALIEHPQFNVSLHSSGTKLIQKKYVNIGVAVATPAGLMVPVIKNADRKSIWQIAAEIAELGEKAKNRKLTKDDMQGACFTISSLGNLGGTGFTPIVNAPEVAILGVSRAAVKPLYINGEFEPRKILPYSLSYDHRAVNGVDGGLFCTFLGTMLKDIRLLAL